MAVVQTNLSVPSSSRVRAHTSNTMAFVDEVNYGTGDLYVTEDNLIWRQENGSGFCFEYPKIALHAVSRDLTSFPHECIYMIVDKDEEEERDEEVEDEDTEIIKPIRFVPEDKNLISSLFTAINDCQALHPDPCSENDSIDEEGDEEESEEMNGVHSNGHTNGNHFRDADEDEVAIEEEEQEGVEDSLENVELSERGRQILRRININFGGDDNQQAASGDADGEDAQFEDAN